jgi:diguanylate cyclase (GGDEF)-like protein
MVPGTDVWPCGRKLRPGDVVDRNGRLYAKLVDGQAELRRLAAVDPLTRVANRRAFDDALEEEWRRAVRSKTTLALLLIDVDRFKAFNDVHGHVVGDRCLQLIADVLAGGGRRAGETVARYSGEEFAILLPGTDLAKASALAQHLLQKVRELDIPRVEAGAGPDVTISMAWHACFQHAKPIRCIRARPFWSRRPTRRFMPPRRRGATKWRNLCRT